MHRDDRFVRRNLLAIPGAILTFYGLVGLVYVLMRKASPYCEDSTRFLIRGACYSGIGPSLLLLLLGAAMLAVAFSVFRPREVHPERLLQPGTPTYVVVSVLASLVIVPALLYVVFGYLEGRNQTVYAMPLMGVLWQTKFLLMLVAALALKVLVAFLTALWMAAYRAKKFMAESQARATAPRFPGEPEDTALPPLYPPPGDFGNP